jgi:aminoglycoside phosphotransferase (APT) family kinase protein
MNHSPIPEEKRDGVASGLREAFGVNEFEEIRVLAGRPTGALVYRIVVRGTPFLLRLCTRRGDTAREFACMRSAAEAGLAPRVWYTNTEDRISITDFVEAVSFPVSEALVRMPVMLRTLHALPPFPTAPNHINTSPTFLLNGGPAVEGYLKKFREAGIVPEEDCSEFFEQLARIAKVYQVREEDMVSSHNDLLRPENVLFDGRRAWLIDWEAAFLNDRYSDLAVAANYVVSSDADLGVYLETYFGRSPDANERARFFLMRQVVRMFYGMAFLFLGAQGKTVDLERETPEFAEFFRRVWENGLDLSDNENRIACGRVHWKEFRRNARAPRFEEAFETICHSGLDRYYP